MKRKGSEEQRTLEAAEQTTQEVQEHKMRGDQGQRKKRDKSLSEGRWPEGR